jgi:hypothetical protein
MKRYSMSVVWCVAITCGATSASAQGVMSFSVYSDGAPNSTLSTFYAGTHLGRFDFNCW